MPRPQRNPLSKTTKTVLGFGLMAAFGALFWKAFAPYTQYQ